MILIVGPVVIVGALLMLIAPRLFAFLMRCALLLIVACAVYVWWNYHDDRVPAAQSTSATVR